MVVTTTVQKYNFIEMRSVYLGLCLALNFILNDYTIRNIYNTSRANHLTVLFNLRISDTIDVIDHDAITAFGQCYIFALVNKFQGDFFSQPVKRRSTSSQCWACSSWAGSGT